MILRTSNPAPLAARGKPAKSKAPVVPDTPLRTETKTALVIGLLRRKQGASLNELVAATCWQPHTTRAALTALRHKGHTIARDKRDGVTRYAIVPATKA